MTNEQRAREWLKSWRVHYGPEAVQSLAAILDAVEREAVERERGRCIMDCIAIGENREITNQGRAGALTCADRIQARGQPDD